MVTIVPKPNNIWMMRIMPNLDDIDKTILVIRIIGRKELCLAMCRLSYLLPLLAPVLLDIKVYSDDIIIIMMMTTMMMMTIMIMVTMMMMMSTMIMMVANMMMTLSVSFSSTLPQSLLVGRQL